MQQHNAFGGYCFESFLLYCFVVPLYMLGVHPVPLSSPPPWYCRSNYYTGHCTCILCFLLDIMRIVHTRILCLPCTYQVKLPQDSHLSALMAAAEKEEKEKEEKEEAGYESPTDDGPSDAQPHGSLDTNSPSNKSSKNPAFPKGHDLTAAVDKVEESVHNLAVAAVAAVAARYEGKDVSHAAVAAQAAAAAAVSATNVLPPGYVVPEDARASEDGTGSPGVRLPGAGAILRGSSSSMSPLRTSAPIGIAPRQKDQLVDAVASRSVDAHRGGARQGLQGGARAKSVSADGGGAAAAEKGSSSNSSSSSGTQLESIDISGLISQLSSKKDEGMVDDKLIRDLEIIQSLIGALKAPIPGPSGPSRPTHKQHLSNIKQRGSMYGPVGSNPHAVLQSTMSFPH